MLISNRVKALAAVAVTASFIALGSTAPVSAQSGYAPGVTHAGRHHGRAVSSNSGREAYGMAIQGGSGFADGNSPAATGGGSIGYNRKLLEY